jgi:outer membrane protein TolC
MVKGNRLLGSAAILAASIALAACNNMLSSSQTPTTTAPVASAPAIPAVPFALAKFSFAPITGAPSHILSSLSARIAEESVAQNVALVPSGDAQANYVIKGYLSAVGDSSGTILVYVWDVLDASGRRVHRISGQETTANGSQDPWLGVDQSVITNVARRTISSLVAWGTTA